MLKHNSILPLKNQTSSNNICYYHLIHRRKFRIRLHTFCDKTIKIGVIMFAVAALDAIWVKQDAITHTTTKRAASGISNFAS